MLIDHSAICFRPLLEGPRLALFGRVLCAGLLRVRLFSGVLLLFFRLALGVRFLIRGGGGFRFFFFLFGRFHLGSGFLRLGFDGSLFVGVHMYLLNSRYIPERTFFMASLWSL